MAERLVTPAELADYLSVDRSWVYANADRLGVRRLGSGPRARLRFSIADVDERLTACSAGRADPASPAESCRRRSRRSGTNVDLLPIRGRPEAA
jgi:hypothetical protein